MKRPKRPTASNELREVFAAADAMTAAGQEPRRHHIVPRFYLDRWAENGRVTVTELDSKNVRTVAPKEALVEKDFYRVPAGSTVGSSSPVVWEAWLSKIEGETKKVFDKFDRDGWGGLDADDIGNFAVFIGVQFTRGRWARYQQRWMSSVGIYRALELDRPGAIAAQLEAAGEEPTAGRIAEIEAMFARVLVDPWQMRIPAIDEMVNAQRSAVGLADALVGRRAVVYETTKPIITCDEPVVSLWERMNGDHARDGGLVGTPIVVLPMDPHHVVAMFRSNMPIVRLDSLPLEWRDTLDLNSVIAGNAFSHTISQPSNLIASKLRVPEAPEPLEMNTYKSKQGDELLHWRVLRRWTNDMNAPVRPVASWWPPVVPPGPPPPTARQLALERKMWETGHY